MKALTLALAAVLLIFSPGSPPAAWGQSEPGYVQISDSYRYDLLSREDLEDLVSPIALYPDPLIAQILPAATFVDQIDQAADFVRRYGLNPRIEDQPWDISVKAVAHYPDILYMMDDNYEWTVALGQAFVSQQQDLMDAIQSLRQEARERGNLYSTGEQQVIYDGDVVRIVPASPEYIYVPVYDPTVVYFEPYTPTYPLITFGMGYTIGAWLNRDCNWHERRIYHHGWRGDGWVHRARPHVHDRRRIYTNRRASVIHVDDRVMRHDTRRYREQLRNDSWRFRERREVTTPGSVVTRPGRPGRDRDSAGSAWTTPGSRARERSRPASGATSYGRSSTYQRPSGSTVTTPGRRGRTPGATVRTPGSTVTTPGSTVTTPGSTVTTPGSTVTRPGSTVTTPGSTVTAPVVTTPTKTGGDRGTTGNTGRSGSGPAFRGTGTGEEMRPAGGVWRRQEGGGRGRGTGSEQRSPASGRTRQSGTVTPPATTQSPSSVSAPASGSTSSAGRGGSVFRRSPSVQSPSSRPAVVQPRPSVQPQSSRPPVVQPPAKVVVPQPSVQRPASRPSSVVPPPSVGRPAPSAHPSPVVQPPAATVTPPASTRQDLGHRPAAPRTTTTTPPLSTPVQQREPGGASSGGSRGGGVWRHR